MYHTSLIMLDQLCPLHSSIASCLTRLREAKIQLLNLGNMIICPQQHCILFFQQRKLVRMESFTG